MVAEASLIPSETVGKEAAEPARHANDNKNLVIE